MNLQEWLELEKSKGKKYSKIKHIHLYGEVFTPFNIIDEMLAQIPEKSWSNPGNVILEPTSGTGNFLLCVLEKRIKHGIDIETALNTLLGMEINGHTLIYSRRMLYEYACYLYLEQNGLDKFRGGNDKRGKEHYRIRAIYASIIKNNIRQVRDSIFEMENNFPGFKYLFKTPLGKEKGNRVHPRNYSNAKLGVNENFIRNDQLAAMFSEDVNFYWEQDIKE